MILPIHRLVRARMADAVSRLYAIPADDPVLAAIPVEAAPRRALGDLAVPLAFELARRLRKAPRAIAQEIVGALGTVEGFSRIEAAPNGYVNFFLDRPTLARAWLHGRGAAPPPRPGKAIVEHTAINPNKAAHIGHLRNAALGDALGRLLRFLGRRSRSRTTSTTPASRSPTSSSASASSKDAALDEVRAIADDRTLRLLLLGSLRAGHRVVRGRPGAPGDPRAGAARHRARRQRHRRARRLHRRPHRPRPSRRRWGGMNIGYDLLTWEGDILRLHFWTHAFEFLKADRRRVPPDRGQAGRLLGDAHRRRASAMPDEPSTTTAEDEQRARR